MATGSYEEGLWTPIADADEYSTSDAPNPVYVEPGPPWNPTGPTKTTTTTTTTPSPTAPWTPPTPPNNPGGGPGGVPRPPAQFNDPLTAQYEGLLQSQLDLYGRNQRELEDAAERARKTREATEAAVKRLTDFINGRVTNLQGPAYTGPEAEVLRTQLLDPMERDRQAARDRALQQISSRGFDPSSGIAQDLLRQVDQAFDSYRISAQGGLAKAQIQEERSREQEAQALLQYLAMLPDAVARGDLDFVAYVQNLIAHPGEQGIAIGQLLADLPSQRLNDALATMGIAPSMSGVSNSAIQMLQQQQLMNQMRAQQSASVWGNIGRSIF